VAWFSPQNISLVAELSGTPQPKILSIPSSTPQDQPQNDATGQNKNFAVKILPSAVFPIGRMKSCEVLERGNHCTAGFRLRGGFVIGQNRKWRQF
jgi:hypothetical protein